MEDFVTFEIAKKLKEKGFPIKTELQGKLGLTEIERIEICPTISQVLKWLREEKKIFIEIALSPDGYQHIIYTGLYCMATSCAYHFTFDGFYRIEDNYITYEQAAIAGIEYVINKLI